MSYLAALAYVPIAGALGYAYYFGWKLRAIYGRIKNLEEVLEDNNVEPEFCDSQFDDPADYLDYLNRLYNSYELFASASRIINLAGKTSINEYLTTNKNRLVHLLTDMAYVDSSVLESIITRIVMENTGPDQELMAELHEELDMSAVEQRKRREEIEKSEEPTRTADEPIENDISSDSDSDSDSDEDEVEEPVETIQLNNRTVYLTKNNANMERKESDGEEKKTEEYDHLDELTGDRTNDIPVAEGDVEQYFGTVILNGKPVVNRYKILLNLKTVMKELRSLLPNTQ